MKDGLSRPSGLNESVDVNWMSWLGLQAWKERLGACAQEAKQAAQDRFALAALEWARERRHWQTVLVLVIAVVAFGLVAALLISLAVLVYFWDTPHRIGVAWTIAGVWAFAWCLVVYALRSALLQKRPAFALTKAELARDCQEWQEWCDRQAGPSPQQEKDGA